MKISGGLALVLVSFVALTSGYGFKLNRNPYSGECKLQLNLPGTGLKDAYPGLMNTRYGGTQGKYGTHYLGSNHYGSASSLHSSLAGHHHGAGGLFSAAHVHTHPINSYGGAGTGSYGSGSYGSESSSSSSSGSSNYGSGGSNYNEYDRGSSSSGSYGSTSNSYGSGSSSNYEPAPAPNYGGNSYGNNYNSNKNYESSSSSSSSSGSKLASGASGGGSYGGGRDRDRDREADYESSSTSNRNYAASSSNNRGTYGGGNRESDYDRRPSAGSYGGSSDYDRDSYGSSGSRESSSSSSGSKYASSSSSSSSSSGNRGSSYGSAAGDRDDYDYRPSAAAGGSKYGSGSSYSESSRGSSSSSSSGGGSYGGSSSGESYGESFAKGGNTNRGTGISSASAAASSYDREFENDRRQSSSSASAQSSSSRLSSSSGERYGSGERDFERPRPRPAAPSDSGFGSGEDFVEEYVSKKSVSKSSSSSTKSESKKTVISGGGISASSSSGAGRFPSAGGLDYEGQPANNLENVYKVPNEFEECGVYEYYSKKYHKCVKIGSFEDEELQREKKEEEELHNLRRGSGGIRGNKPQTSASTYAGPDGASSSASRTGGGSVSTYANSRPGNSGSGATIQDEFGNNERNQHVSYNNGHNSGENGGHTYGKSQSSSKSQSSGNGSSSSFSSSASASSSAYSSSSSESGSSSGSRRKQESSSSQFSNDEYIDREFANQVIEGHNAYRARHTTPPVTIDEKMSIKAQEWAYALASGKTFTHSPDAQDGIYGENLHIVNYPSPTGADIVDAWYREKKNYDYRDPLLIKSPKSLRNSHFTAMIWKSSRKVGVGKATSNDGRTFVVVNYWPVGNIVDVLEDNVLPSRTDLGSTKGGIY